MTRHEHHWQPFSALAPFNDIPLFWCSACKIVMDTAAIADYGRMWQENAIMRTEHERLTNDFAVVMRENAALREFLRDFVAYDDNPWINAPVTPERARALLAGEEA